MDVMGGKIGISVPAHNSNNGDFTKVAFSAGTCSVFNSFLSNTISERQARTHAFGRVL
jgi:hypothetical protein